MYINGGREDVIYTYIYTHNYYTSFTMLPKLRGVLPPPHILLARGSHWSHRHVGPIGCLLPLGASSHWVNQTDVPNHGMVRPESDQPQSTEWIDHNQTEWSNTRGLLHLLSFHVAVCTQFE